MVREEPPEQSLGQPENNERKDGLPAAEEAAGDSLLGLHPDHISARCGREVWMGEVPFVTGKGDHALVQTVPGGSLARGEPHIILTITELRSSSSLLHPSLPEFWRNRIVDRWNAAGFEVHGERESRFEEIRR